MKAFAVLFFFVSILLSTGQCFVLPAIPPKAAGGCYQIPPDQREDTTVVVDDAFWLKMGKMMDEKLDEKLDKKLGEALKPINEKLDRMGKQLTTLDKRTGFLVEESARKLATRKFGDDFSRSFTIKSIRDLVTLISQANTQTLPFRDREVGDRATEKVIDFLNPLLPVFLEAAVDYVAKTMNEEAVFNSEALKDAKQKIRDVQEILKASMQADTQPEKAKLVEYCGIVLGSMKELSTAQIDGESTTDRVAREKKMNMRFQPKLKRIQKSLKDDGKHSLATCEGAGILMCSSLAAAGRTVWEGGETSTSNWIREKCIIFDSKGEIECDLRPSVEIVSDIATIMVGEIKSSINHFKKAKVQMREQIRLLEFGLWCIFENEINPEKIAKKGQFFVLEAGADRQSLKSTIDVKNNISFFVHKVGR